jgi:hypothetical protein
LIITSMASSGNNGSVRGMISPAHCKQPLHQNFTSRTLRSAFKTGNASESFSVVIPFVLGGSPDMICRRMFGSFRRIAGITSIRITNLLYGVRLTTGPQIIAAGLKPSRHSISIFFHSQISHFSKRLFNYQSIAQLNNNGMYAPISQALKLTIAFDRKNMQYR